jgi:hypothetical protein
MILHLKTQRGQPYGSERRCCERCGAMIWGSSFELCLRGIYRLAQREGATYWTDDPARYEGGTAFTTCVHVTCVQTSSPASDPADLCVV